MPMKAQGKKVRKSIHSKNEGRASGLGPTTEGRAGTIQDPMRNSKLGPLLSREQIK
jgi:hypothetical protein